MKFNPIVTLWLWSLMLMEETVFSQAVLDLNQTFYKDDVRYFDLDKLAGLPYGPGASLGFTQWTGRQTTSPATDANVQIVLLLSSPGGECS
jgi:hypothetical protein